MKRSPLSTPSGSRGRQGFGWRSHNQKNRTGYTSNETDGYSFPPASGTQMKTGDDFLPLNVSTPDQKSHGGNWHRFGNNRNNRNSGSGEYHHYRNNYVSPKSNFSNSNYSPYKHPGRQSYDHKKAYQKDAHRRVNISAYVDMKSFLEDPWVDLTKKLEESRKLSSMQSSATESSIIVQSHAHRNPKPEYEDRSVSDVDDSQLSQDSKNDTSMDTSANLDDTDLSISSKAESSINLMLDTVSVSQQSNNKSIQGCNENPGESSHDGISQQSA